MYKVISVLAVCFFLFIVWIIYLANTGGQSVFFDLVRSVSYGDKLGHAGLFGFLTVLATIGLKFQFMKWGSIRVYYGVALVLSFVMLEECSQAFIPTRTFDLVDMFANLFGILFGAMGCFLGKKYFLKPADK